MTTTTKPDWYLALEKDADALARGRALEALQRNHARKIKNSNNDHDYSDCIGTWQRGEALRKGL